MANDLEVKLEAVFQDMKSKLQEADPQITTGVQKFIDCYNKIQATAAGRRKYGSRGKSAAPKGYPPIHCIKKPTSLAANRHLIPVRREPKGKRPHNLTANIRVGQQNAGKW